jgi:threonylcarbamoyladenosine tRNA methylthiotransferase MtaB
MVLKRMKRRHTRADAIEACRRARRARADVVFGADLIAGFPTETEPMFLNTLSAVAEMGLTYLHVFPYSPRPGTPAARMPQVPVTVRKERAAVLRAAGEKALARFLESRIGTIAEVLVEKGRSGRCRHYAPVHLGFDAPAGAVVGARFANVVEGRLVGTRAA